MRGVAVLDFPWSDGSRLRGMMELAPSSLSRRGSGGKWRPTVAPGCRGSGGAPDGRGRRGAPGRASALSSPGKQRKGRRKRNQKTKKGAHRRRRHPRARIPELPIHTNGCWGPGVGSCAGTFPSYPKGIPDDSVAAGGCTRTIPTGMV
jgi:hypothetical protein